MSLLLFFFFNDTATTEIYTLSLHDALPISQQGRTGARSHDGRIARQQDHEHNQRRGEHPIEHRRPEEHLHRSEEHTSELQSQSKLVCRLLLEKKKKNNQSR